MIAALVRKELRELLPFIALALLAQCSLVGIALDPRRRSIAEANSIPFVRADVLWYTFMVAIVLAVALGLWQTMWESSRGTFLFLLHRPLARETMLGAKLATGALVCLLVTVLPVAWYAIWAATPGTHASPFEWSMTAWAWQWAVELPLVYLGAFLSGLRPARLFGSRFAPLVAGAGLFFFTAALSSQVSGWWPAMLLATLAIDVGYVAAILHVAATRDYS